MTKQPKRTSSNLQFFLHVSWNGDKAHRPDGVCGVRRCSENGPLASDGKITAKGKSWRISCFFRCSIKIEWDCRWHSKSGLMASMIFPYRPRSNDLSSRMGCHAKCIHQIVSPKSINQLDDLLRWAAHFINFVCDSKWTFIWFEFDWFSLGMFRMTIIGELIAWSGLSSFGTCSTMAHLSFRTVFLWFG